MGVDLPSNLLLTLQRRSFKVMRTVFATECLAKSFPRIGNVRVAIFCPGCFVMAFSSRFFAAVADGFNLVADNTVGAQCLFGGIGTTLPQRQVVFTAASLIGVAAHGHLYPGSIREEFSVSFGDRTVFLLNGTAVEIEVDAAF